MSSILPIHVFLSVLFLQTLRITSLPEEAFFGYPLQTEEDYVYLDSRADPNYSGSSAIKQSETRRRSILDKNFARFGRSGGYNAPKTKILTTNSDPEIKNVMYLNDDDVDMESFGRNARSGERNDQFIRFGRGKSDFVRFGRSDGGYQRNRDFIRFGRSTRSVKPQKDEKTQNYIKPNTYKMSDSHKMAAGVNKINNAERNRKKRSPASDFYKKADSNFVRFGRDRNDNFMRFGRLMNQNLNLGGRTSPVNPGMMALEGLNAGQSYNNTANLKKYLEVQGQQEHELLLKLLVDILSKGHLQKELQQLQAVKNKNEKQEFRCN